MNHSTYHTHLNEQGRLTIPAALRRQYGFDGQELVIRPTEEGLLICSLHDVVKQAQALVKRHTRPGWNAAQELKKMRREEAEREFGRKHPE